MGGNRLERKNVFFDLADIGVPYPAFLMNTALLFQEQHEK